MRQLHTLLSVLLAALSLLAIYGCADYEDEVSGRVEIDYWERWSGFERDAMQAMVNEFNESQESIHVNFLSVSQIERKLMLATAGGNPPDLAGIDSVKITSYAQNGALQPLDRYAQAYGIRPEEYLPAVWNELIAHGRLWALPTTPGVNALHWNKTLFREAGLDPERPPRTLAELEAFNEQITRIGENGQIEVLGHHPQEPGWWMDTWCYWFGGDLWDGQDTITAQSPENLDALGWVATYPERFGASNLIGFKELSGNFASPQNPFFQGRVAMVLQGPWMYNFINNFAPEEFEWGVAPFPTTNEAGIGVTVIECNVLVIPKCAKHPDAAFEFMAWLQRPENIEQLNLKHLKFSPLVLTTEQFYAQHPNPHIKVYRELAEHPNARGRPRITTYTEYRNDMINAFDLVARQEATPEEALGDVQERQQKLLDRMQRRWNKVESSRMEDWDSQ